jgi:hypothetical protein
MPFPFHTLEVRTALPASCTFQWIEWRTCRAAAATEESGNELSFPLTHPARIDPDGTRRVERFQLSPEMRDLIENFDRGNSVASFAGFELKKPRPSERFGAKAKRMKKYTAGRRKALINGRSTVPKRGIQGEGRYSKPAIVVDLEVRNGSGRVHFKKEVAEI